MWPILIGQASWHLANQPIVGLGLLSNGPYSLSYISNYIINHISVIKLELFTTVRPPGPHSSPFLFYFSNTKEPSVILCRALANKMTDTALCKNLRLSFEKIEWGFKSIQQAQSLFSWWGIPFTLEVVTFILGCCQAEPLTTLVIKLTWRRLKS